MRSRFGSSIDTNRAILSDERRARRDIDYANSTEGRAEAKSERIAATSRVIDGLLKHAADLSENATKLSRHAAGRKMTDSESEILDSLFTKFNDTIKKISAEANGLWGSV